MKIYISDKKNLKSYTLPSKIEDSFVINYTSDSGVLEKITLTAEGNKWSISSSYDIKIFKNGVEVTKDFLDNYCFYQVKFSDLEEMIMLYCFDIPIKYYDYDLGNKDTISLGRQSADILYDNAYIANPHFVVSRYNNQWIFKDQNNDSIITFINNKREHSRVLSLGDVIFTNGLKIIWMDTFIRISNPANKVKTTLQPYKGFAMMGSENKFTPVKETEKLITLYGDNDVFFHKPRTKNYITWMKVNISPPPPSQKSEGPSLFLTMGTSLIMGVSSTITSVVAIFNMAKGETTALRFITQLLICVSMILGSLLLPVIMNIYNKRRQSKLEKKRVKIYSNYLNEKKIAIEDELKKQHDILFKNNLSIDELLNIIASKNNNLIWNREIVDADFLTLRLGIGNRNALIQINTPSDEFNLDEIDKLKKESLELANHSILMENVPITISLADNKILPLIISDDFAYRKQFIDGLMLQLFTYHSGMDLKIIVFTDDDNKDDWNYLKFLSHCYSKDRKVHFFATNEDEIKNISYYLEKEYIDRLENISSNKSDVDRKITIEDDSKVYKNFDKYYLIITDQFIKINKYSIIKRILNSTMNLGFSLLFIEPTMKNIPSQSASFVEVSASGGSVSDKNENGASISFQPEIIKTSILPYSSIIANIPIDTLKDAQTLPTMVTFLEMYQVGKIEQLNILNRWQKNDPVVSLHTPIGINEEGKLFELDLHEKFQGPHGLIAGATGSGKSEFIITFILSLAVNYHPYEVQFVLIDYKGGGLAGAFENRETGVKIPHLAGTITNLDTSEMNRTLVSIKSELKRRQRMFNEARDALNESTVDIYKYQRFYRDGKVSEPISHLFIISDEFAELKAQQPEFMDELISTSRIGRSLGVHLILATQKPSGVVNDQIWSNSRFKVCLKVQTAEDSMELLKRKEAASIKETGRFYLQVGYNESFELGQSAWAGAKYIPTDRIIKNINDSIDFITNTGEVIKNINETAKTEQSQQLGDQLTNIVKTLYNLAIRENITFKQLWLPSIPPEIYLSNLFEKYNYNATPYIIDPLIGEYDVPANQYQNKLTIDLTHNGNLLIYGIAGSGKENLITTLIYSICLYHSPDEVNFYILDFGAEILKIFSSMPHVGDVVLSDDKEKIKSCFLMLEREMNRRKELFSEYGGSYVSYIQQSKEKLPLIVTVLNGYEAFMENCGQFNDYLSHLLRECNKYGIVFIMTAVASNSVNNRIAQSFTNRIALQLSDNFDYVYLLGAPHGLTPAKYFGRGIVAMNGTAFEFQSALIYIKNQINDTIKNTIEQLKQSYPNKASHIPIIPKVVNSDTMLPYVETIWNVPIGINTYTGEVERYNFASKKITMVLGKSTIITTGFLTNLVSILSSIPDIRLKIFDFSGSLSPSNEYDYFNGDFTKNISNINKAEKDSKLRSIYLMVGISYIYDKVLDEGLKELSKIFNSIDKFENSHFIFVDNYPSYRKITKEAWYDSAVDKENSIWVGQGIELQNVISINKLSKSDINDVANGTLFRISNGNYQVVKGLDNPNEGGLFYQ